MLITTIGQTKIAAAASGGPILRLSELAVGDADGALLTAASTALGSQRYRSAVSQIATGAGSITLAATIPGVIGGFTIREAGVFDLDGDLIACGPIDPPRYKPLPVENQPFELRLNVSLAINPATALVALKQLDVNEANAQFARADLANIDADALRAKLGMGELIISGEGGSHGLPDGTIIDFSGTFE